MLKAGMGQKKVYINGSRTFLPIDGMNRVLLELCRSLDRIAEKDRFVLVIPHNVDPECQDRIKDLKRISIRKTLFPYFRGWTELFIDVPGLLPGRTEINLSNRCSLFGGGINMLHDIIPVKFYGTTDRRTIGNIKRILKRSDCVLVPSAFTQKDIESMFRIRSRLEIIHPGWQHYRRIRSDESIFDEYPSMIRGEYFFSVSSISPHKNYRFIHEAAKRNPDRLFVAAGELNRGYGFDLERPDNLLFLGRICDSRVKALMMNCRAFIYPSLYEGAGLPPLEALSCGVPVLAADIEPIHELCRESVHYFDPDDFGLDIDRVLQKPVSAPEEALNALSWDAAARKLKAVIDRAI